MKLRVTGLLPPEFVALAGCAAIMWTAHTHSSLYGR